MAHDILIVDDEADIRELISGILSDEGYRTRVAGSADEALAELQTRRPSLLILDIWLEGSRVDGIELLIRAKQDHPFLPVVMISGHGNIETAVNAIRRGAYDFIEKPFKADRLLVIVERAIEAARLRRENHELRQRAGPETEVLGTSAAITGLRNAIAKVAPTGSRVLVTGAAGAGKEVVARRLHAMSRYADGPFVVVNAATIEPDRMEIELFGIETNSRRQDEPRKVGLFELAHGGTLFLDEVADMPLQTQSKILRVLVDQTFERVGGSRRVEVDVRVVSASCRDLASEIEEGNFREDLYHRLNVVPLKVPSLSERREDIPILVKYFMQRSAEAAGLALRELAEDAMAALQAYEWPGNVRQLRNVVEQLLIMAPGDSRARIAVDMIPPEVSAATPVVLRPEGTQEIMAMPLREARETFEREYLLAQITRFGGNISRTASFVGMERSALHRKLKSLGVHGAERVQSVSA
jgi:two-component system nitrogen regulation response regulator NtrX